MNYIPILTGLIVAVAVDYRKYLRAKKQNPTVTFDWLEAALTWIIGIGAGGAVSVGQSVQ